MVDKEMVSFPFSFHMHFLSETRYVWFLSKNDYRILVYLVVVHVGSTGGIPHLK